MMELTINLSNTAVRAVPGLLAQKQARAKKGPQTIAEIELLTAIVEASPDFLAPGDEVDIGDGEVWVVDSEVDGGLRVVICSIGRESWKVADVADCVRVE